MAKTAKKKKVVKKIAAKKETIVEPREGRTVSLAVGKFLKAGLNIKTAFTSLFEQNTKRKQKWSDEEIAKTMKKAFPIHAKRSKNLDNVQGYRKHLGFGPESGVEKVREAKLPKPKGKKATTKSSVAAKKSKKKTKKFPATKVVS